MLNRALHPGTSICAVCAVGQGRDPGARRVVSVALREGSLVVNSSQGGGTKDTWVLER